MSQEGIAVANKKGEKLERKKRIAANMLLWESWLQQRQQVRLLKKYGGQLPPQIESNSVGSTVSDRVKALELFGLMAPLRLL